MLVLSLVELLDCQKRFTQASNLVAHEKSHSKTKIKKEKKVKEVKEKKEKKIKNLIRKKRIPKIKSEDIKVDLNEILKEDQKNLKVSIYQKIDL